MAIRNTGSGDYLIRNTGAFYSTTAMAACFWLYPLTDRDASSAAFGLRDTANSNRYIYFYNANGDGVTFQWEHFGGDGGLGAVVLGLNTWRFIAFSRAGTGSNQTTAYNRLPGDVALTSQSGTYDGDPAINEEVVLSNGFNLSNGWFPGRIAALKQWDAALTADELWQESMQIMPVRLANLHSWRPMADGNVAGAVLDYSGNGRALTSNGAPTIEDGPPIPWRQGGRRFIDIASGVTINAAAVISGFSRLSGASAVNRVGGAQINARSGNTAQGFTSKVAQAVISARSGLSAMGAAARQAAASFAARSRLMAGIFGQRFPLSIDRRTIATTWSDTRIIDGAGWRDVRAFPLPSIGMTKTGVKIKNVVIGDDFRVERTYTTLPTGVVITMAWLTMKKSEKLADVDALMQLPITTTLGVNGQITDADTTGGNLAMFFDLSRLKTALAKPDLEYVYDIQVRASDGQIHTLEKGTVAFIRGVTDANS